MKVAHVITADTMRCRQNINKHYCGMTERVDELLTKIHERLVKESMTVTEPKIEIKADILQWYTKKEIEVAAILLNNVSGYIVNTKVNDENPLQNLMILKW